MFAFMRTVKPQPHKVDARSLATLRVFLSAFVVHDIFRRLEHGWLSLAWYYASDEYRDNSPYLPSILDPNDTPHGSPVHKIWFYRGSPQLQIVIFSWTVIIAIMFGIGYRTQWSSILLWIFMNGIQNRSPHLADGSDLYLRNMLLWCTLCPMGRVWSVDAAIERQRFSNLRTSVQSLQAGGDINYGDREEKSLDDAKVLSTRSGALTRRHQSSAAKAATQVEESNANSKFLATGYSAEKAVPCQPHPSTSVQSVATLGCTLQICLMYYGAVYRRFQGSMWLPPRFTAVYYVFNNAFASRQWAADFVRVHKQMSRVMTAGGMIVEVCCPLACLLAPYDGKSWRHIPAAIMAFFHLTLYACMILFNWQFMSIICSVLWIPPNAWDSIISAVNSSYRRIQLAGVINSRSKSDQEPMTVFTQNGSSTEKKKLSFHVKRTLSSFFFFYMIYNWCGERGWISKHDGGDIGEFLRFNQNWLMYGSDVSRTSLITFITGKLKKQGDAPASGEGEPESSERRIDLLKAIRTNDWGNNSEMDRAAYEAMRRKTPGDMAARFPSWRWEVALKDWVSLRVKPQSMTPTRRVERFGRVLCIAANEALQKQRKITKEMADVEPTTPQHRVTHIELAFWTIRTVDFEHATADHRFHPVKRDDLVVEVECV